MDTQRPMALQQFKESSLSRRTFLKASAGASAMLVVHSAFEIDALAQDDPLITGLRFFNSQQAATVEAIAERIWPATDESPGARDAGVVYYIDHALAGEYEQYQLDYRVGLQSLDAFSRDQHDAPFRALTAEQQDALLENIEAGTEQEQIDQAQEQQGEEGPAPSTEDQQGQEANAQQEPRQRADTQRGMEDPAPTGPLPLLARQVGVIERQIAGLTPPEEPSLQSFFDLVYAHTMEGLFADPIYGGNRDFAGWRAVGYPGAYYVYTEEEQQSFEPLDKPFQSIADL